MRLRRTAFTSGGRSWTHGGSESDYRTDELVAAVDSLADGDDVAFCYGETPGPHDWFFARRGDVVYVDATFLEAHFCFMTYDALRAAFDEA